MTTDNGEILATLKGEDNKVLPIITESDYENLVKVTRKNQPDLSSADL